MTSEQGPKKPVDEIFTSRGETWVVPLDIDVEAYLKTYDKPDNLEFFRSKSEYFPFYFICKKGNAS